MHRGNRPAVGSEGVSRFKPYELSGVKQPIRNPFVPLRSTLYNDDDVAIEREEELPTGDVMRRDQALEKARPLPRSPPPSSLPECFEKGVLDLASAAVLIHDMKIMRNFSEGSYEEFVRYVATHGIKKLSHRNFSSMIHREDYQILRLEGSQLAFDVLLAKSAANDRRALLTIQSPQNQAPARSSFCISNCTRSWTLHADEPFVESDLVALSMLWTQKRGDSVYTQAVSLFRHLLRKITDPQEKIKEYSIRLQGGPRDRALKSLPDFVESVLLDFAEDMLGYGRDELKPGAEFDRSKSRFYLNLGKTDDEREESLEVWIAERSMWRKELLRALQRAL